MFFTGSKLLKLNKRITETLIESSFIKEFENVSKNDFDIDDLNLDEKWISHLKDFINTAFKRAKFRIPGRHLELYRDELFMAFIYMTHATLPNPIIKTAKNNSKNSLVAAQIYQNPKSEFLEFLNHVRSSQVENHEDPLKEASYSYAAVIKTQYNLTFGRIYFENLR